MKKLPKRNGIRRVKLHHGRSTRAIILSALAHMIPMALANIGETEGYEISVRTHGKKPRIAARPLRRDG
jgi:hypothetical protein